MQCLPRGQKLQVCFFLFSEEQRDGYECDFDIPTSTSVLKESKVAKPYFSSLGTRRLKKTKPQPGLLCTVSGSILALS